MTPSDALYNRILWDPRFDAARWVLGVEVRASKLKKVQLVDFVPGGDLPWHRVQTFEADGVVVWDRRTGLDAVDASECGRAPAGGRLPPGLTVRPALRWDGSAWKMSQTAPPTQEAPDRLQVLCWNVLFDRYDEGQLHSEARRPLLADALARQARSGVDLIALQELQWPLLKLLLAADWLREGWQLVLPGPPREVHSHGLALLCRTPVEAAGFIGLGHHKGLLVARLRLSSGPVLVATTHLSSDHSKDASHRRAAELSDIRRITEATELPVVVLGDFNDESPTPPTQLGLRDLAVDHPAFFARPTFDPSTNPLALENSRTGAALRLDRVLARPSWRGSSPQLIGTTPTADGLHPSDHFGVRMAVAPRPPAPTHPMLDAEPVHHTALCWVLPPELAQALDPLRHRYDPAHTRWPAHVNLRFGFVAEHHFERAAELLQAALGDCLPIPVKLDTTGRFGGRRPTLWLDPTSAAPAAWSTLEAAIAPAFPRCAPGRPHLTIARSDEAAAALDKLVQQGISGMVQAIHLVSRRGKGPMQVRATVPLGGGAVVWHDPAGPEAVQTARDRVLVDQIEADLAGILARLGGRLHRVGSWAIGVATADSDLDLVAVLPDGIDQVAVGRTIRDGLRGLAGLRAVVGARVPGLNLQVHGLDVDLACVTVPEGQVATAVDDRLFFDEDTARTLSGVADAALLREGLNTEAAQRLARTVKTWAAARQLDQRPLGGLPSVGWLVLVVDAVRSASPAVLRNEHALLLHFFERQAEQLPERAVALHPSWSGAPHLPLQVCVPAAPHRACSDAVSASMSALISDELLRAFVLVDQHAPLSELAAPPPWHRRHAATAVLTASDPAIRGRLRGRVRALLQTIEDNGVEDIHAVSRDGGIHIGLGRQPPSPAELHHWAARWLDELEGVTLTVC